MSKEIKVTGCKDCPMFDNGSNYEYVATCKITGTEPKGIDYAKSVYEPITPDNCPLKKESITVTL
jgi:hypothetical protein